MHPYKIRSILYLVPILLLPTLFCSFFFFAMYNKTKALNLCKYHSTTNTHTHMHETWENIWDCVLCLSVCGTVCVCSRTVLFFSRLYLWQNVLFSWTRKFIIFTKHTKKTHERCTFLTKKTHKWFSFFWMHFQLEKGRRRTIRNLGQPTMNILTTILVREWKASFFFVAYFLIFHVILKHFAPITNKTQQRISHARGDNNQHYYCEKIELQHIRLFFLWNFLYLWTNNNNKKKTQKKIILFYLLQIPLWKNLFAGLWHLLWLETDNKFAVFTGKRNNDVNSYKFASFANCIQLSGIYGCKVGWILGEKFTLNQSNNTEFQHEEQIFFRWICIIISQIKEYERVCLLA